MGCELNSHSLEQQHFVTPEPAVHVLLKALKRNSTDFHNLWKVAGQYNVCVCVGGDTSRTQRIHSPVHLCQKKIRSEDIPLALYGMKE